MNPRFSISRLRGLLGLTHDRIIFQMTTEALTLIPPFAASLFFLARISEVFTKRDVVPGTTREKLTFRLFMLCGSSIFAGGLAEYFLRGSMLLWPTFIVGCISSIASFVIRRSAIRSLGKFWSLHVEMREGHEFVTRGPFAFARHPVYFSMILELLGIGLILNAWVALIIVFVIFTPTMFARVRIEERALLEQFGDAYRTYMQHVPAIFPRFTAWKRP